MMLVADAVALALRETLLTPEFMAQRTRKAAGPHAAADPRHASERPVKAGRGKTPAHAGLEPGMGVESAAEKEELARKKIMEEFNDREDLSERQLNNRNWL